MKLNLDPEWVKRSAEQEDGKCVTAMSPELYAEMMESREQFIAAADIEAQCPITVGDAPRVYCVSAHGGPYAEFTDAEDAKDALWEFACHWPSVSLCMG